jgi:hypothetical protein
MTEALQNWITNEKIKLTDDQFVENVKRLAHDIMTTLSPEQQLSYHDSEQASARAAEQRRINREASERKQREVVEQRRLEREFAVGQGIRNRFFAANPHATESDFQRLWVKLRDEAMLKAMDQDRAESVAAQAADPRYSI